MTWKHWVLVVMFLFSIARQFYYADRPRPTTGLGTAWLSVAEFGFYIWLVVSL